MDIEFPKSMEDFLQRQVENGRFLSVAEAVRAAVRDFERREDFERSVLENERNFVAIGIEALERGEVTTIEDGDIRREGLEILAQRKTMRVG